jgi:myo-inositol-1-phosphate synthase
LKYFPNMARKRVGIWLLGAKGGVATTAIVGLCALRRGLTGNQGLVTQLPLFANLDLISWDALVVGGHEVRKTTLHDEALKFHNTSRVPDKHLINQVQSDLEAIDANIRPGVMFNVGKTIEELADASLTSRAETPRESIKRVQQDIEQFKSEHQLDRVVVLNVASTEPPRDDSRIPSRWSELDGLLDDVDACPLAASSLYAIAALDLGHAYVNFTPSLGSAPAAICELALERGTCHMGHDGKTGETLLKSALAPMFANRNLEIMSWVGHNIFGNMDGKVLNDPVNKQTKVTSKDHLLAEILGYHPQTHVSIEYIESLGDWKTAWDHIHFKGFLGTPMVMQFTWQGCDSLLAAPLVLDLVRLTECAQRRGCKGLLTFLASFFKSPLGVHQNDFVRQFQMLQEWVAEQTQSSAGDEVRN